MRDYTYIGSSPCDEECAQVGAANYHELSKLELAAFKKGLEEKYKKELEDTGASFGIKEGEIVCFYDTHNQKACDFAYMVEGNTPATWAELNMKAPRLDDEAFTKDELIPVPTVKRMWMGSVPECQLGDGAAFDGVAHGHAAVTNEFIDGRLKIGQWAIMCPACFGMHGSGLGVGYGQRYKKATDGNFYKVEG